MVDNASGDGAVDRCVPDDPRFSVMRLSDNLGIGGFDERLFCILEDVDLAFRLRLTGGDCSHVATAWPRETDGCHGCPRSAYAAFSETSTGPVPGAAVGSGCMMVRIASV